ncbi:LuxR C-terminal-related transcriptional regulator [Streptomyces virginiae]|uniref:LuxR C-terminal-related transcriptional regulator n=1 Tax=Streptomyces virginiae TaxID=1961 RepID=UPI0036CAA092
MVEQVGSRWPLIGRESELMAFEKAMGDRAVTRFIVCGAAGVGKSRLAEECLNRAVRAGLRGARATASAAAATVPLGAIAHLLSPAADLSHPPSAFAATAGHQQSRRIIWVDDLHLLDEASAVMLQQLADARAVRLIATLRSGQPISEAVQALCNSNGVHRINLTELNQLTVGLLLQAVLGGPIGRRTVRDLYEKSDGNILYLRELVVGALANRTLDNDGEIWELSENPEGTPRMVELIEARLSAVGHVGRQLLESLALCEPLSTADAQEIASPEILEKLVDSGLVQTAKDKRRISVQLAHPLYGEVLRSVIPFLRRRSLLMEQVKRIEARGSRRRDDMLRIAAWQLSGAGSADPVLIRQAAGLARHVHDYRQVSVLLESLPDAHHTISTRLLQGEALYEQGRPDESEDILSSAYDQTQVAPEKVAVNLVRTWNLFWGCGRVTEALAVNDRAKTDATDRQSQHILRINEGCMRTMSGQPDSGLLMLEELNSDIEEAPNVNIWLTGMLIRVAGLAFVGRTNEALKWSRLGYDAHRNLETNALFPHPAIHMISRVFALSNAGRLHDAIEVGENAFEDLVTARAPAQRVWITHQLGRAQWLAGHPKTAREWYAESAALARKINHKIALRPALAGLASCAAQLGDLSTARDLLEDLAKYPPGPHVLEEPLSWGWLLASSGELAQARRVFVEGAEAAQTRGHFVTESLLLFDAARMGGAKDATPRLVELARLCDGPLTDLHARFATSLAADDPEPLRSVSVDAEHMGADLLAAEAATLSVSAAKRRGRRTGANAVNHIETLTTRCQGARTPVLATAGAATLTAREREIALLAAAGTSSKGIADALHLSARTVDNHLTHAYAKLAVSSRRGLARALGHKP